MAKKSSPKSPPPDRLVLSLADPAFDALLRAGVGGLATTLLQFADDVAKGRYGDAPDIYFASGPPWEVTQREIVFRFPDPTNVASVLEPIFRYAFGLDGRVIDLRPIVAPTRSIRLQIQRGLMLTFLQHGKSRKGAKSDQTITEEIDGKPYEFSYRPLDAYKHQQGFADIIDAKTGGLSRLVGELPGTLYPGAAVRHNAFAGQTKNEAGMAALLAAHFAPIGTLALSLNRGSAVLLVPDVTDLIQFAKQRRRITPSDYRQTLVGGAADAVLGMCVRIAGDNFADRMKTPGVTAYSFQPTPWATQQKSRVASLRVEPLDADSLRIFKLAQSYFQSRSITRTVVEKSGKGKAAKSVERTDNFFSPSLVRPFIADNLANRRRWYEGFTRLFVARDPATNKPLRDRLFFEKGGLIKMINSDVWDEPGQKALVGAVHRALRGRYGQIASENEGNRGAMQNRFRGEYDRWRLAFSGAKTADQFRHSLCDLFGRVPTNKELQANWPAILPWLGESHWQHARDLSLLALASYQGKGSKELDDAEATTPESSD